MPRTLRTWWRHQMETFSALLTICAGNSPVPDEFPAQRPVRRSFDVFFNMSLNKRLRTQSWGWWFETLSRQLWRHCNYINITCRRVFEKSTYQKRMCIMVRHQLVEMLVRFRTHSISHIPMSRARWEVFSATSLSERQRRSIFEF